MIIMMYRTAKLLDQSDPKLTDVIDRFNKGHHLQLNSGEFYVILKD